VAESSWPNPATGRVVDDSGWEKLGISLGPAAAVYGDFTNPQLIYADSTGMQIKVAADRYAVVRGHVWWSGSSIVTKTIASNSSGSTRTDLVVLRFSRTTWDVTVQIVQGTPGAGPPSSTKNLGTTGVYELVLAQVTVANNASTITAGNVTYVATHVGSDGRVQVADVPSNSLAYVPQQYAGMEVSIAATAEIYIRNSSNNAWVLSHDASFPAVWRFGNGRSTDQTGIGATETTVLTVASATYRANRAYRLEFFGGCSVTVANNTPDFKVRKANTTGQILSEIRIAVLGNSTMHGFHHSQIFTVGGTDVTAAMVLTVSSGASYTTSVIGTQEPIGLHFYEIGPSSSYTWATVLV
jgi:hypothetical protein